jgi:TolB-like protein/tetratricopeptide (TPR) repeat protein
MLICDLDQNGPNAPSNADRVERFYQRQADPTQHRVTSEVFADSASRGTSLSKVGRKNRDGISEGAIRNELDRIVGSPVFVQSERLGHFLRFTVETTLEDRAETLKEYVIGTHVYGRKSSYQPTEDSIVRSEARRLRRKLQEFYDTVGKNDLILIRYRPGSYVPAFQMRHQGDSSPVGIGALDDAITERPELRVAVLPFFDLSKGDLSAACARLLTDDLIHDLIRTEGVRVTNAHSGKSEGSEAIDGSSRTRKLDAHIVFEGTVGEDGNQLRVTTKIVTSSGLRIWSERFEADMAPQHLFNISAKIASALTSRVCSARPPLGKHAYSSSSSSIPIHPLVFRAEALLDEGTMGATHAAVAKWQELIENDPHYVRAICGIAQSYCEMALRGVPDSAAAISDANQALQRAAELDADLIEFPACRGSALTLSWRWREAEISFKKALALGEHPATYRQYALLLAAQGRLREAWNYIQKAQQIDPFSYRQKVLYTRLLYLSRNYEDGLRYVSEQLLYGRLPNEAELYRAMMLFSHNRRDEASRVAQELLDKASGQPVMMSGVAELLAACGETDAAGRIAADADLFASNSPISKFRQALLLVALGNRELAIHLLSVAYEEHEAELIWLGSDPRLDTLRRDARFAALLDGVMLDSSRVHPK